MTHQGVWVDTGRGVAGRGEEVLALSTQEVAMLRAFALAGGRVMGRHELQRRIGLGHRHPRRCDSLVVQLRRALGSEAIVTVRGRGWRCVAEVVSVDGHHRGHRG